MSGHRVERWRRVVLMLLARPAVCLLAQSGIAGFLRLRRHPRPWPAAGGWWMVYGSLADGVCLLALSRLSRRERLRLWDLIVGTHGTEHDVPHDLVDGVMAVLPGGIGGAMVTRLFYGGEDPPQVSLVDLPRGAAVYSAAIWPVFWSIAEETTYLGHVLPLLEELIGSTSIAATITASCWAGQHVTMPLILDRRYLVSRVLGALPACTAATAVYKSRGRHLAPLIVAHWLADTASALYAVARADKQM